MINLRFFFPIFISFLSIHYKPVQTKHTLANRLLNYCRYVSNRTVAKDSIKILLNGSGDLKPDKVYLRKLRNKESDSIFFYHKHKNHNLDADFLTIQKIKNQYFIEVYFDRFAPYSMDLNTGLPRYEREQPNNICYHDLISICGKPIPDKIQPKDTYNCSFVYNNPSTHLKVTLQIVSFNAPDNDYNEIFRIYIINNELKQIQ